MGKNIRRTLVGCAAIASLMLTGCGGSGNASSSSSEKVPEAKVSTNNAGILNVGVDLTYPPYDMLKDGKPAGFDVEFMNAVAENLGLKAQYTDTRFAQIVAGIKSNRYDVIASTLYISAARAKEVDFVPYFQTGNSIISRVDGEKYLTAQDLCGKTVGVVTATVIASIMPNDESEKCRENGKGAITVKEFPTDPEATQALLANQVDAQMTDGAVAKIAVEKSRNRLELTSQELIYPIAVGIGVSKGNAEMQEAVSAAIESMKADGSYDKLLASYNLEPVDPEVLKESLNRK
ncbi:MAG: ABC transporter substrate-binding protein [Paeniglutamicibacter sp.]|uniref:ABC transporter substrate-binding protein n=1 Tax=Arthrobacter sp. UCD-GKA TaxID=1913576 RepID=UPI0009F4F872|nr:ABC transporter substrate-binding protein [Arthrobacter sp. UCD-GKA]